MDQPFDLVVIWAGIIGFAVMMYVLMAGAGRGWIAGFLPTGLFSVSACFIYRCVPDVGWFDFPWGGI